MEKKTTEQKAKSIVKWALLVLPLIVLIGVIIALAVFSNSDTSQSIDALYNMPLCEVRADMFLLALFIIALISRK